MPSLYEYRQMSIETTPSPCGRVGEGSVVGLKPQRHMPHQVEPCRGSVAYLVVAVVLGVAVRGHDTAVHPATLCKVAVEDIVEVQAEDDLLQACAVLPWVEGITEAYCRGAIARQGAVQTLGVVQILTADEVGVPYGFPSNPTSFSAVRTLRAL